MSNREQRLLELLAREGSKLGPVKGRTPSQFRETMQDTHQTMPAEYFGPHPERIQTIRNNYATQSARGAGAAAARAAQRTQSMRTRTAPSGPDQQPVEFRSVFRPRPEQEYVCQLATERRKLIENSEWALIDTLEVDMFLREKQARAAALAAQQAEQRAVLDRQMAEKEAVKRAQRAEQDQERTVVISEVARHRAEEERKAAAARARNTAMRNEREAMLVEARAAKAAAKAARQKQEQQELDDVARQLEAEKQKAAVKVEAQRAQWLKTTRENEERIAARKAKEAAERDADERLMAETIATLERQEREREERTKAFHAMVEARGNKAGAQAVAENKARAEREARLMAQFEVQKEAEYKAKEAADAAKRAKAKEELLMERQRALGLKAQRAGAAKAQVQAERAEIEARAAAEAEAEAAKLAGIRARAAQHQGYLRGQMTMRTNAAVTDDTGMTDAERQLNARLLNHALHVTGGPRQYSVKLY